jgi:UDP-N-acetyl-D-mannosaminuronate dehydrogenase
VDLNLLTTARQVNEAMPRFVADLVLRTFRCLQPVPDSVLGLAMKDYSNDDRMSPALAVIECLQNQAVR